MDARRRGNAYACSGWLSDNPSCQQKSIAISLLSKGTDVYVILNVMETQSRRLRYAGNRGYRFQFTISINDKLVRRQRDNSVSLQKRTS